MTQAKLFAKEEGGKRRVYLSTNVAESSITLPVRVLFLVVSLLRRRVYNHAKQTLLPPSQKQNTRKEKNGGGEGGGVTAVVETH